MAGLQKTERTFNGQSNRSVITALRHTSEHASSPRIRSNPTIRSSRFPGQAKGLDRREVNGDAEMIRQPTVRRR
jgi:hypothetical protein